eukprot:1692846-Amphidinium_carterae.1
MHLINAKNAKWKNNKKRLASQSLLDFGTVVACLASQVLQQQYGFSCDCTSCTNALKCGEDFGWSACCSRSNMRGGWQGHEHSPSHIN